MNKFAITAVSAALLTLGASTAFAAGEMSKTDMATAQRCKAMSQSAMQGNSECVALMKAHPDMMNGSSTTGMSGSTGGGMSGSTGGGMSGSSGGGTSR